MRNDRWHDFNLKNKKKNKLAFILYNQEVLLKVVTQKSGK